MHVECSVAVEDSDGFDTDLDDDEGDPDSGTEQEEPVKAPNELLMEVNSYTGRSIPGSDEVIETNDFVSCITQLILYI